jgi:hypothetical protein
MQSYLITTGTAAIVLVASAGLVGAVTLPKWSYKPRLKENLGGTFAFWAMWYFVWMGLEAALAITLYFLARAFEPKWRQYVLDGDVAVCYIMLLVTLLVLAFTDREDRPTE